MSEESQTKGKPVVIPADLHQSLKIRAASEGRKLNELVIEKLNELVPPPVDIKTAQPA